MTATEIRWRKAFGHGVAICVAACLWAWPGGACRAQEAVAQRPGQPQDQAPTELITRLAPAAEQSPQPQENAARPQRGYRYRVAVPDEIPGASAPPIQMPPYTAEQSNAERQAVAARLYHGLPSLPPRIEPQPGPCGGPMTLADLQAIAVQRSPIVRQAEADVTSARGAMIQAGTPQNPTAGFEGDDIGTGYTGGYQGIAVEQVVPMGGKLRLARAAKEMDFKNAQVALRRTCLDVFTTVRANYFATLVAAETLKINRALAQFTAEVYRVQIDRVKAGEAAPYEPMQVRVLAFQAHAAVVQSTNAYLSAWRQLAAALCAPEMPPTQLAGDVTMPVPNVSYEAAYRWIMEHNTKLMTARNAACGAQFALTLARRTPWVPDLDIAAVVQQDYTTEPGRPWVVSLKSTVAIPLWDKNRGNILAAEGALTHANQGYAAARDTLAGALADAYARYDANKVTADYYRRDIIGDQVQSWRGLWERHQEDPDAVQFTDVVAAQQTLAQTIQTYAQTLAAQWQAVVDLTDLMEVDDLFQIAAVEAPEQLPPPQPISEPPPNAPLAPSPR